MSKFKTMVRKDIELCDEYIDKNMATHSEVNALLGKYVMDYPDFNKNIISYASVPGYETNVKIRIFTKSKWQPWFI